MPVKCATKFDWYQTSTTVVISVLRLNVVPSKCVVSLADDGRLTLAHADEELFDVTLAGPVDPKYDVAYAKTKCEITLRKANGTSWSSIDAQTSAETSSTCAPLSFSDRLKRFDEIGRAADEDPECNDKDQLNGFFQKIYKNMDDDGRRAMAKSFQESAGTVLSTNWGDVGKSKVDIKPPEGMEHKQYER